MADTAASHASSTPPNEKASAEHHVEVVSDGPNRKLEDGKLEDGRKSGDNGFRTDGDDEDHEHEPPMTLNRAMSLVAMAFLWTSSQIPVYLFGGIPPVIYGDIGGPDRWIWFVLANLLALAAVCPFVGALSDLFGRRWVSIGGSVLIIIGMIVCSTAKTMNPFIGGMAIAGAGAGVNELTALAATSELAPTAKRGKYVAILVLTILPFAPSVLWSQLIAQHTSWRWVGLLCGLWSFIGLVMVVIFYHPPPRVNSNGLTRRQVLARVDYVGGLLSISGVIIFIAGLLWGGYGYTWTSVHTLVPLFIGALLLVLFAIWEIKFAPYPMFPRRIGKDPRILAMTLVITFISGANFFAVILFWPTQAFNVYGHDPVGVGLRGLPIGFSILIGACVVLWLLSVFRGNNRALLIGASIMMTAGTGAMAAATRDNLPAVYGILVVAGLGIGGIVVPASIMTTIICPDDLIATVAALTLSIRVIGGAIGFTVYYNVFYAKLVPKLTAYVLQVCLLNGIYDKESITTIAELIGASLTEHILHVPGVDGNVTKWQLIISAGELAYSEAYPYVYYASIAFGCVAIIASCMLGDINKYMDDHVAVVIH